MRQLSGNNLETMAQWGTSRHVKSKKGVLRILGQTGFFGKIVDVLNRQVSIQQLAKRREFFVRGQNVGTCIQRRTVAHSDGVA